MYNIWRGRLFVGPEDLGSATMWTSKTMYIPAIGGNLKMTSVGEYKDMWQKIIGAEPFDLSKSRDISGGHISIFTLLAHSPRFCDLIKELTSTPQPRILTAELYNPYVHICVVLVPHCNEVLQLGLTDQLQPHLHAIFVSSVNLSLSMAVYSYQRSVALQMKASGTERFAPWKVCLPQAEEVSSKKSGCNIKNEENYVLQKKTDAQNIKSSEHNIPLKVHEQNSENMQNFPVTNSEVKDEVSSSPECKLPYMLTFQRDMKKVADGHTSQKGAINIKQDPEEDKTLLNHNNSLASVVFGTDGQILSSASHAGEVALVEFEPTAAGIENVVSLLTKSVVLEQNSCCRFEKMPGKYQHDEMDDIKEIDAILMKKIQNLHSPEEGKKPRVSRGATARKKFEFYDVLMSSYTVKRQSRVSESSEILELDNCSPIDRETALLTPLESVQINWENDKCSVIPPSCVSDVRRVHLLDANADDVMKLKMPVMKKSNHLTYCSMNDILKLNGFVYVRPDKVKDLLDFPQLWQLSHKSTVRFAVCISLTDIVNNVGRPILISKCLLLLHHTAFVDKSLGKLLEKVIEDRNRNANHHHKILITKATLKLCILSLHYSKRATPKEDEVFRKVLSNVHCLTRCLRVQAGQIIDGGPWKDLGGTSPLTDYLHCLRVTHHCLKYAHRHPVVLIGNKNWAEKSTNSHFYKITTTTSFISEYLM